MERGRRGGLLEVGVVEVRGKEGEGLLSAGVGVRGEDGGATG